MTFHDGSPLTAEVVKNNLDAYRGAAGDHARSPLLFLFVLDNIESVEVSGERDVVVTTKVPWVAFPAFLYSSGRLGITAQAQLDDTETCNRNLIGTGPFKLESPDDWVEGREFRAVENPDYWQDAPDGEPYPYLDEIVFEPIIESEQRVNALLSGRHRHRPLLRRRRHHQPCASWTDAGDVRTATSPTPTPRSASSR